jgi:hypothetical protein
MGSANTEALGLGVSTQVHVSEIHPDEEWLVGGPLPPNEVNGAVRDIVVNCYHAFFGQRAGVCAHLLSHFSEAWVYCRVVFIGSFAVQDAARTVFYSELGALGII